MSKSEVRRKKVQSDKPLLLNENLGEKKTGRPTLAESELTPKMRDVARLLSEGIPHKEIMEREGVTKWQIDNWKDLPKMLEYGRMHISLIREKGTKLMLVQIKSMSMYMLESAAELASGKKHRRINKEVLRFLKEAKDLDLKVTEGTALKIAELATPRTGEIGDILDRLVIIVGKLDTTTSDMKGVPDDEEGSSPDDIDSSSKEYQEAELIFDDEGDGE